MSPRQKVFALAAELGATIEDSSAGLSHHFNIDAPHGFRWKEGGGLHCLVAATYKGGGWTREMWADALERMEQGLEPCPDYHAGDCEMCEEKEAG